MVNTTTAFTETDDELFSMQTKKSRCWKSIYICLKLLKYLLYTVLRMLFDGAATATFKCSSLFKHLSNNLKTPDMPEEFTIQTVKNRCESFFNKSIGNKELIEINRVNADTVNKVPDINLMTRISEHIETYKINAKIHNDPLNTESGFSLNYNTKNEQQVEKIEVDVDTINAVLNTESNSSLNQNIIHEEQIEINEVNADIVNLPLKIEHKSELNEEIVNQMPNYDISDENNENFMDKVNADAISPKKSSVETGTIKVDKKKFRSSLDLITQTLRENKEKTEKFDLETTLNTIRKSKKTKNNDNFNTENVKVSLNKSDNVQNEVESYIKQGVEKNNCLEVTHSSCVGNLLDNKNTTAEKNVLENYNNCENRKLNSNFGKQFNIVEKHIDILNLPPEYSLAYCISSDFNRIGDAENAFKAKFGKISVLMDKCLQLGDVEEILIDENRYVFYLVVERKNNGSSMFNSLEKSLHYLLQKMKKYQLNKLAISKSVFYKTSELKHYISKVFAGSNIEVTLCINSTQISRGIPKNTYTSLHLWEMEPQTDLIIFVNLEEMYLDSWKNYVVENVNARYPFKDKLLKDITIKPMAAGDVLTYKVNEEFLFCVFFKHDNPKYFECLEKAFKEIKSQLTGYRFLGIQLDTVDIYNTHSFICHLVLLKSVFSYHEAEIWICGDIKNRKNQQIKRYQKVVNGAIEINKKVFPKSNANSGFKAKRKKYNSNGFDSTLELTKDISCNKTSDLNTTENWD